MGVREGLRSGVVVFKILKTYLPNCFLTGRFHSVTLYSLYLRPQALLAFLAHSPFRVCPFRGTEVLLCISIYILTKTGHLFKFGFFYLGFFIGSNTVCQNMLYLYSPPFLSEFEHELQSRILHHNFKSDTCE